MIVCVFSVCKWLTSGLNLSMFPAVGWAGKWQALSKISAVFTGMMGIYGTFPTAVKSSAFPAPLNIPRSFLRPVRVPIKQLRRLVFGSSCRLKGVINSWKTVFTVRATKLMDLRSGCLECKLDFNVVVDMLHSCSRKILWCPLELVASRSRLPDSPLES